MSQNSALNHHHYLPNSTSGRQPMGIAEGTDTTDTVENANYRAYNFIGYP